MIDDNLSCWKLTNVALDRISDIQDKVDKINRRAKRLKLPAFTTEITNVRQAWYTYSIDTGARSGAKFVEPARGGGFRVVEFTMADVILTGRAVVLPGWNLVARLDILKDADTGENIVTVVRAPTYKDDFLFSRHDEATVCDHCKSKRYRKAVFVVEREGRQLQVGQNCLMDFLGTNRDPSKLLSLWADLGAVGSNCDEPGYGSGGDRFHDDVSSYLPWVAQAIRKSGWLSRSAAGDSEATADMALRNRRMFFNPFKDSRGNVIRSDFGYPEDLDFDVAKEAVAWAKSLEPRNDYEQTINTLARAASFDGRKRLHGYAASIVSGFQRHADRLKQREAKKSVTEGMTSSHVGVVGDRMTLKVRMTARPVHFDGQFGTSILYQFMDLSTGGLVVGYVTGGASFIDDVSGKTPGDEFSIKMTPKSHGEYKGKKQTKASRFAFVPPLIPGWTPQPVKGKEEDA